MAFPTNLHFMIFLFFCCIYWYQEIRKNKINLSDCLHKSSLFVMANFSSSWLSVWLLCRISILIVVSLICPDGSRAPQAWLVIVYTYFISSFFPFMLFTNYGGTQNFIGPGGLHAPHKVYTKLTPENKFKKKNFLLYSFFLCQNLRAKKISACWVSPKWVKSNERRREKERKKKSKSQY